MTTSVVINILLTISEGNVIMKRLDGLGLKEKVGIDISPLIDMVFILLVFFIVTTVFLKELGMTAQTSDVVVPVLERVESFTVRLNNRGETVFNDRSV